MKKNFNDMFKDIKKWVGSCKDEMCDERRKPKPCSNNIQDQPQQQEPQKDIQEIKQKIIKEEITNKQYQNHLKITIKPQQESIKIEQINKPQQQFKNLEEQNLPQSQSELQNSFKQTNQSQMFNIYQQTNYSQQEPNNFQNFTNQTLSESKKILILPNQLQQETNQLFNQTNENVQINQQQQLLTQNQSGSFQKNQKIKILCTQQNQNQFNFNNQFQNNYQQNPINNENTNSNNSHENNDSVFYSIQQSPAISSITQKFQELKIRSIEQQQQDKFSSCIQQDYNYPYQNVQLNFQNINQDQQIQNIQGIKDVNQNDIKLILDQSQLTNQQESTTATQQSFDEESVARTTYVRCMFCNNDVNSNYIQLSCYHQYCQECLKESIKFQVRNKQTYFSCECGKQIRPQQIWDQNDRTAEMLKQKLWENQIEVIRKKLSKSPFYKQCSDCRFFVLDKFQTVEEFQCPDCQTFN